MNEYEYMNEKKETHLYADHHIQMTLAVLLYHVTYVVRFSSLLKLPPSYKVLYFSYRPYSVTVGFRQPAINPITAQAWLFHDILPDIFIYQYVFCLIRSTKIVADALISFSDRINVEFRTNFEYDRG